MDGSDTLYVESCTFSQSEAGVRGGGSRVACQLPGWRCWLGCTG